MLISIWGRDGIGKSTFAEALGFLFSKKEITTVIDTDLTQPTLPSHINGTIFTQDTSLGKAVSGIAIADVTRYLHQQSKRKALFYSGLTDNDDYLSYEIGLEADNNAQDFISGCKEHADTVIIDISGQRTDPFVPGALVNSDKVILLITPDVQGICWYKSVQSLLETMNAQERILPVVSMTEKQHDLSIIEKEIEENFIAALPFVKEFRQNSTMIPQDGTSYAAVRYLKQVKKIHELLRGAERD